ncbi:hypothetical protein CFP56_030566 [Quercus suber]|uniref:Uncharacterized protein n=1 Tax=Quercus suber TaxID=58331 RepID=A0AAW0JLZ5_QUESU
MYMPLFLLLDSQLEELVAELPPLKVKDLPLAWSMKARPLQESFGTPLKNLSSLNLTHYAKNFIFQSSQ